MAVFGEGAAVSASRAARRLVRARYETARELDAYAELRDHEGLNATERRLLERCFAPGARLLDVGAGAGREALGAARLGYAVTALDLVPAMVRDGRVASRSRKLPCEWLVADATALPVASGAFDGALLVSQLLEHFHRRAVRVAVLREVARCVRPGGHLLVTVHNGLWRPGLRQWLWRYAERRAAGELPRAGGRGLRRAVRAQTWLRAADLRDARRIATTRLRYELEAARRRLGGGGLEPGDGWTDAVSHAGPAGLTMPFHPYNPGELEREAAQAGLEIVELLPHPEPPAGRLGALARGGSAYRAAALRVPVFTEA